MAETKVNDVSIVESTDQFRVLTSKDGSIIKVSIKSKKFSDASRTCIAELEFVDGEKVFRRELNVISRKGINMAATISTDEIIAQLLTRPSSLNTHEVCILLYPSFDTARFTIAMDRVGQLSRRELDAKVMELTAKVENITLEKAAAYVDLEILRAKNSKLEEDIRVHRLKLDNSTAHIVTLETEAGERIAFANAMCAKLAESEKNRGQLQSANSDLIASMRSLGLM